MLALRSGVLQAMLSLRTTSARRGSRLGRRGHISTVHRSISSIRGMPDLFPEVLAPLHRVMQAGRDVTTKAGYQEMSIPVLEKTEVFQRSLGTESDIVGKEMYTFDDKSGDSVTLRPEGTASIMRAVVNNPGKILDAPLRYFYTGPMFRYERPQRGRQRQFHQLGIELIGDASPYADVEAIVLARDFLHQLTLGDSDFTLQLNSLGNSDTRQAYNRTLLQYFQEHHSSLSPLSQQRLAKGNALRILDSKDSQDRQVAASVPSLADVLTPADQAFQGQVLGQLDALGIQYQLDPYLVRGLDYYTHTIFEFVPTDPLSPSQSTLLAGGRYDGLGTALGYKKTQQIAAIGWAAGVERIVDLLQHRKSPLCDLEPPLSNTVVVYVCCANDLIQGRAVQQGMTLAHTLRSNGYACVVNWAYTSPRKAIKHGNKYGASWVVLLGENEVQEGSATVKDMATGEQTAVPWAQVGETVTSMIKTP